MKKRVVAAFLTVAFVLSVLPKSVMANPADDTIVTENKAQGLTMSDLEEQIQEETLSTGQQQTVDALTEQVTLDPEAVAEELNQIAEENPEDSNYVEKAAEGVLDELFEENSYNPEAIDKIKENNTSSIVEDKIEDYEEAKQERDNADSLAYDPSCIMVQFAVNTEEKTVKKVMDYLGDDGEIIIGSNKIDDSLPDYKKERLQVLNDLPKKYTVAIDIKLDKTTDRAIEEFEQLDCVESASKDYEVQTDALTNDPKVSKQWYLKKINIQDAWKSTQEAKGGHDVWVAVIDSGYDTKNPVLNNCYLKKYSYDITQDKRLDDCSRTYLDYHGSSVSAIIAEKVNDGVGMAGVSGIKGKKMKAWTGDFSCSIMAIQAAHYNAKGEVALGIADVMKAIDYAIYHGAEVINISSGTDAYIEEYQDLIDKADAAGISVVASAGNFGVNIKRYPANYNHVISVMATTSENKRSSISNYGMQFDISAPGERIFTAQGTGIYGYGNGTSFAAPIVSAVLAQMISVNYTLTPEERENILYSTATDLGASGKDEMFGYGLVNAGKAVQTAIYKTFIDKQPKSCTVSYAGTGKAKIALDCLNLGFSQHDRFYVYRSEKNGENTKTIEILLKDLSFCGYPVEITDTGLKKGVTYKYTFCCASAYGKSVVKGKKSKSVSYKAK